MTKINIGKYKILEGQRGMGKKYNDERLATLNFLKELKEATYFWTNGPETIYDDGNVIVIKIKEDE